MSRVGHVASERLGEAARHGDLSGLREAERRHVGECEQCRGLFGAYRLTDRLLSAPWQEVRLPESVAPAVRRAALGGGLPGGFRGGLRGALGAGPSGASGAGLSGIRAGLDARRLSPVLATVAIVALVAAALGLPRLVSVPPASSHSPIAAASPTGSPPESGTATPSSGDSTSSATPTATGGAAVSPSTSPAPEQSATPVVLALARVSGTPIAWAPDGAHLLVSVGGSSRPIQIRDASGRVTGSLAADAATWVDSATIVFTSRSLATTPATPAPPIPSWPGPSAAPAATANPGISARPSAGHHGAFPNWRANVASIGTSSGAGTSAADPAGNAPAGVRSEGVGLADASGALITVLPGAYSLWAGIPNGQVLSGGTGSFTVAGQNGLGGGWQFDLWTTSGGLRRVGGGSGIPIAFSRDGAKLVVLHPASALGLAVSGWPAVLSVPGLANQAAFPKLQLRVSAGGSGSAYGFEAALSPDGNSLLASGVFVNLTNGATVATGRGGWLADGRLVTASAAGLLRWTGGTSNEDSRFAGSGRVLVSRHGELIYLYDNGRALLLTTTGRLVALSLPSVRAIAHLLISPTGRAIALDGRATDGSSIAAVAQLP